MKHLSTLVLAALSGYFQLALGADATFYACYSNQGSLVVKGEDDFQSRGACRVTCVDDAKAAGGPGYSVQAMTNETICLCSQTLPNDIYKVDDSDCKQSCPGYKTETCGTRLGTYFSVYLTGLEDGTPDEDPAPSSSSSSATSTSTESASSTSSTAAASTTAAPVTSPSATATSEPSNSVNTAGVAAGVVVGVFVVAAIGFGAFFLMKKRRRERVEEEYRKSAAAREFARKPEQDHRLDPVMIQRRDSVGSIADNQDYSRRILKVTNPDGN
ncbi:uncharacterized protein LAJ45_04231 [Morchella importuna]|uniref:WSC domain-containing protein n=1 Tax=Morchella conica CCBAS932 TaxID=1392247 RepID=A0A3N4KXG6_9PEZI|nr:uncharacterized protein LAJ45_04231 [Morchella importuna]KAH8151609.1 hypothetical protein LAJ45_04231 [Morchella importuna]RPB15216.1 hypothetical protein P167DRAFT_19565 [Morchella conica CCBAS932]